MATTKKKSLAGSMKNLPVKADGAKISETERGKLVVDEYMRKLKHPYKEEIESIRQIVAGAGSKLAERVKWNAPSFYYKEDFAAFNLRAQGCVMLVLLFPRKMVEDKTGLLEGDWKDRRLARFYSKQDILKKKSALTRIVKQWVKLMDE